MLNAVLHEQVQELPPEWPTMLGLAGVVALGLAFTEIVKAFHAAAKPTVQASTERNAAGSATQLTTQ